ncbi:sensor histidine kinase [Rubellimicrobium aerolatum]|uniref:histidine kinase n=1 Tax=Rubellimicrobium aerolatum TaxID=490979 RepID=A0ABW0SEF5_9RHOB|nr:ATP-binding protein [Rubellimicrobium aerolatum]MBP1806825.1 two-component system C4-dicarboxylate transport sensor histidine kinase DctB [Rubellimicrobium aerolatum]
MTRTTMARRSWGATALLAVGLLVVVALVVERAATRFHLREGHARAEATLNLAASGLGGWLRRFEVVPQLLADDEALQRLVLEPDAIDFPHRLAEANRWLEERNAILGSSELYVIGLDGTTLAASNAHRPDSFVGQNFAYRPYFTEARAGRIGRFFGLGTTSGVRGYYFAGPIRDAAGRVAGVIAVKVGLDGLEAEWSAGVESVLVSDPEGIAFLSSEPGWRYATFGPLGPDRLARSQASRRYADVAPREAPARRARVGGIDLLAVASPGGREAEYVEVRRPMPSAGWTLHVLLDTAPLRDQARLAAALAATLLGALGLGLLALRQRLQRGRERLASKEAAKAELERRVARRTAELQAANRLIAAEVAERRAAESELRRTQADLVQAGKLAALGRISAALSHEMNQPLAAVRNYADNAMLLLDRGDPARVRDNLGQILKLVDRMAAIARHLREVARKPESPLQDVDLPEAVAEALAVAGPRLAAVGAEVSTDLPASVGPVRAGPVRLQQVLVNLLANAADAVEGRPLRRIRVAARPEGGRVLLEVSDTGPGVAPAIADRIFDPFFTTKGVGAGLGLGLSISYNIVKDFGGDLSVRPEPGGGATFAVALDPAPARIAPRGIAAE